MREDSSLLKKDHNELHRLGISGDSSTSDDATLFEVLLFLSGGMGASLCYTATLSSLVYFKEEYGAASFVYLNLGVFFPLVPIALMQAKWDHEYDKRIGSYTTFFFRGVVGFVVSVLVTALIPFTHGLSVLVGLSTVLGACGAVLQGTFNQMASFVSFDSRLKAAVSSGLQASAIVPFIVSYFTNFGSSGSDAGFKAFFVTISCVECVLFGLFLLLMYRSRPVAVAMLRRDSAIYTDLSSSKDECNTIPQAEEPTTTVTLSYTELWDITSVCCVTIVVTLIPSFMVDAWFTKVKSDWIVLPQVLFYTRIAFDFSGRLATLLLPPTSVKCLLTCAVLRVFIVIAFFVVSTMGSYSNQLTPPFVAVIGWASGYLVTGCFQLAPDLLPDNQRDASVTQQASLLNTAFSVAAVGGLLSSFMLLFIL